MGILGRILTAVPLYFFLLTAPSMAHIISLKLRSDNRHIVPFSDFEFSSGGYLSVEISFIRVKSTSSRVDPSRIGFFLRSRKVIEKKPFEILQNTSVCALDDNSNSVLFTFQNLSYPQFSFNKSWTAHSGLNSFSFVNCNNESLVTMDGRAEFYNTDDDGNTKNYLSAGLTPLPFLNFTFSFIYLSFLGIWSVVCFKNKRSVNRTHILMGGLPVMNIVYFMWVAADLRYVKDTGNPDGLMDVLFCIFHVMRAVLLFTVITLIGGGWLLWRPFLEAKDKWVLIAVILLQVWDKRDPILPWEAAEPYTKEAWEFEPFVDWICWAAIFIPMWWSSLSLEEIHEANLIARKNLRRLTFYWWMVCAYVVTSKGILSAQLAPWVDYVGQETSLLVFCMVVFYMFRPQDKRRLVDFYYSGPKSAFHSPV